MRTCSRCVLILKVLLEELTISFVFYQDHFTSKRILDLDVLILRIKSNMIKKIYKLKNKKN